ncbi:unnamed protein product [Ceutorhynchus assimilis]|uniref:Max-binding protein MNT n=1 Tax=Ceutorhynchus assimilis TaxID=467358 RepID=A0A9N9QRV5_9CUCU|nr:unnamed protein product [Ceutorhynchus assimilis]
MSLNTLLEAAKFLEMQEQIQHRTTALDPAGSTTTTIRPVTQAVNGGTTHVQNGTSGAVQTFTLQPVKLLNSSTTTPNIGQGQQQQQTQTVVISSNNISSTFLQGVQGPISFATALPTTDSTSPQDSHHNGTAQSKKEQDGHISSTTVSQNQRHRAIHNSFDIMNPLVIDEEGPAESKKLKQPPLVFRAGTREVHNKLEKHRRAHLKECFDILKKQLPANGDEKKTSNLSILHSALKYIQILKRRERDYEHEMERLAREKITHQQRLATLKKDSHFDNVDFSKLIPEIPSSTTSITQNGGKIEYMASSPSPSCSSMSPTYTIVEPMKIATSDEVYCEASEMDDLATVMPCASLGGNVVSMASPGLVTVAANCGSTALTLSSSSSSPAVITQKNSVITSATTVNGESKISIPILGKSLSSATVPTGTKELTQPVQTAGISVLPMPYQVNQGLVLQKVAIMPHKGLTDLAPLMSTHFITTPQQLNGINGQINGKVVPLTMVVVSTASPRPGS